MIFADKRSNLDKSGGFGAFRLHPFSFSLILLSILSHESRARRGGGREASSLCTFSSLFHAFFPRRWGCSCPPNTSARGGAGFVYLKSSGPKIKIFENVFHGNYVIFHGPMPLLKERLNALICIEIVIICSFQGENCIF